MKENKEYYDAFSERYEDARHHGYHALIDSLEFETIAPYARGRDVLEIGCGTGLILERIAGIARSTRGVDLSPGMLRAARARGLDVVEGDATTLPFKDASFDLVCSFKVLSHVRDLRKAVAEAARVTRPGGVLALEFYNKRSIRFLAKQLWAGTTGVNQKENEVYTRWYTREEIAALFPETCRVVKEVGVRCLTPVAQAHDLPIVGDLLSRAERRATRGALSRYGGFLIAIAHKDEGA